MPSEFFISGSIALVSFVYSFLILIMFLMKHKKDKNRKKGGFYFVMLLITLLSMAMYMVLCAFGVLKMTKIVGIFSRITMFIMLMWEHATIYYISVAFLTEQEYASRISKNKSFTYISTAIITILNLVCSFMLPLNFVSTSSGNPYLFNGLLYNYFDIWGVVLFLVTVFYLVKYRNRIDSLTKILFVMLIVFFGFSYLLTYITNTVINTEPLLQSIFLLILYFSVESQDNTLLNEYNESTRNAKESDKLKSEFIMNMSHQLRTPMNTILGFSDLILSNDNVNIDSVIEDTKNIKMASSNLLELINSILDISKLEGKKEIVHSENYNLENIIYDISSNINSKLKENLVFTINADEICPNELIGDAYKLCKILNTIILNAVNHTEYGEVSLNVSCIQVDSLNHELTFLVKNSGHLMNQEDFNRSFEDLIKLSNDNKAQISADVLNLIVAKGLLELIGGSVEFINEAGKGTQYVIKLKQKLYGQNRLGNIREKIQTKHSLTHNVLSLVGKKVLIIDESKVNTVVLERLLNQYNISIDTSLNPREGIDLVGNNNYDFIIVNHNMEDMSGEDVVKKLNSTGNRVPVIIGLITKANEIKDIYDYMLNCPIEFRELNKIINNIFNGGEL